MTLPAVPNFNEPYDRRNRCLVCGELYFSYESHLSNPTRIELVNEVGFLPMICPKCGACQVFEKLGVIPLNANHIKAIKMSRWKEGYESSLRMVEDDISRTYGEPPIREE